MHAKTLIVCGLLAVTAAGCGDSSESDATPAATTAVATTATVPKTGYVTQVNKLCEGLIPTVLDITGGGHQSSYRIKQYNVERPKLKALYKVFDAKVAAITVTAADRSAAAAFDGFRRWSNAVDTRLGTAAATGKQDRFDAANDAFFGRPPDTIPQLKALAAAGIRCPAR